MAMHSGRRSSPNRITTTWLSSLSFYITHISYLKMVCKEVKGGEGFGSRRLQGLTIAWSTCQALWRCVRNMVPIVAVILRLGI